MGRFRLRGEPILRAINPSTSILTHVHLLRALPQERLRSIDRFGDELSAALAREGSIHAEQFAPGAGRDDRASMLAARFVTYPRAARRLQADVFHVLDHGYSHLARALPRGKTVVTCHDLTPLRIAEAGGDIGRAVLARFRFSVRFMRAAGRVVCVSESTRDDVSRLLEIDQDQIDVIRPGLSARFRRLDPVGPPGAAGPVLLHVGSGMAYKNVPATLRVLQRLRADGIEARLVRVGPRLTDEQRVLADDLDVGRHVSEAGHVTDDQLIELYNSADVFLFPSHNEGFGWPPLEAMACGLPVVTSNINALVETTGDAALSADPDDIDGLAAASARLIEEPEIAEAQRERGLRRAAEFNWERCAASYARVYSELAA